MTSTLSLPQCVNIIPQTDPRHLRRRTPIIYTMSVSSHDVNMKNVQICFLFPQNYSAHQGLAMLLTHWGRVTHLCVSKLASIASDNGLSPGRRRAIIWNNDGILLIGPLGINFSEILIEIHTFSLKKIRLKMSSAKFRPFCLGLNVLTHGLPPLFLAILASISDRLNSICLTA